MDLQLTCCLRKGQEMRLGALYTMVSTSGIMHFGNKGDFISGDYHIRKNSRKMNILRSILLW
jgi:hypothetical protein